jgi:hypothetical protein
MRPPSIKQPAKGTAKPGLLQLLFTGLVLSLLPRGALAQSVAISPPPAYRPITVIQSTPGIHLTLSDGKLGLGLNLDVLAGVVLNGSRCFCPSPGVVSGAFTEVHAVLGQGVTASVGWRAGVGVLAPTLGGGFIPFGQLTYDRGRAYGALAGARWGVHGRALIGGAGVNVMEDGALVIKLGPEVPLVPVPAIE